MIALPPAPALPSFHTMPSVNTEEPSPLPPPMEDAVPEEEVEATATTVEALDPIATSTEESLEPVEETNEDPQEKAVQNQDDMPTLPPEPSSPRQLRTHELLTAHPGLTIPEAMRAAYYTISESETPDLQELFADSLLKQKRTRRKPGSQEPHPTKRSAPLMAIDPTTLPEGIVLHESRPKNAAGRCLCRVSGCRKLDQANNDGFCRSHYNLIVGKVMFLDNENDGTNTPAAPGEPWTCDNCHISIGPHQKRCGSCHRWKNGQRDAITPRSSTNSSTSSPKKDLGTWTCDSCGNEVQNPKTRCGKCHHWKGGKRKGGWTLGEKLLMSSSSAAAGTSTAVQVDDIDRTKDWECCGDILPATKTRCGKCRKWRGGKRQIRWSYANESAANDAALASAEEQRNVDPNVDWVCKVESCKNVNKGSKKRCFKCFSWRFSRKKARLSADAVLQNAVATEEGTGGHSSSVMMTMDHLDALVKDEIAKHESGGGGEYVVNVDEGIGNEAAVVQDHVIGDDGGVMVEEEMITPAEVPEPEVNIETV